MAIATPQQSSTRANSSRLRESHRERHHSSRCVVTPTCQRFGPPSGRWTIGCPSPTSRARTTSTMNQPIGLDFGRGSSPPSHSLRSHSRPSASRRVISVGDPALAGIRDQHRPGRDSIRRHPSRLAPGNAAGSHWRCLRHRRTGRLRVQKERTAAARSPGRQLPNSHRSDPTPLTIVNTRRGPMFRHVLLAAASLFVLMGLASWSVWRTRNPPSDGRTSL